MELQEQIREASTDLFREKGLKFTMEDVARQMHVAKKTIYKYYQSKEDLLMDLVKTGFAAIQECKQKVLDSDLPMKEKIAGLDLEIVEGVGHMPQYAVTDRVVAFIRRIAAKAFPA